MRNRPILVFDANVAARHQEFRLNKVIAMLDAAPDAQRAIMTDGTDATKDVCLTVAIRGLAAFEMTMPQVKYDAWNLMDLINRHAGRVPE